MLGLVDFAEVQVLQRRIVYDLGERGGAALILCEHPPTISIGRSGSRAHIAADDEMLQAMGIRTFYVNRGGGCVLHLPGQLVAYLLLPLEVYGLLSTGLCRSTPGDDRERPRRVRPHRPRRGRICPASSRATRGSRPSGSP